ncbi:MAG: hypothetical protein KatS3mg102_2176 [Planctomycetota bacterium]|nr:MAG: hypothetical protein KatS3mg102_2176 [Planctomycetota bacterium]
MTLRTAGFNAIEQGALSPATVVLMMAVMFVGGSPGSTAGGIKTTTVALLALAVVAALRGRTEVHAFGRRLPHASVVRAAAVFAVAAAGIPVAIVILLVTQELAPLQAAFEAVSALCTVGLSLGATAQLDEVGKCFIAACMFAGRMGPLTLFVLLIGRGEPERWRLPEEDVVVG